MQVNTAKFLESNPSVKTCPSPHMPEYAFIGRSNVGKSSLINAMTNQNSLAKTSSTPGKTQLINHFLINKNWYLVDLPGYGWAKVSKEKRRDFEGLITEYLSERENLVVTFVLVDIRHEPQAIDLEFFEWLAENQIPFAIVFTKADKLNNSKLVASLDRYETVLKSRWEVLPPNFITSSLKNEGTEDILIYIEKYNKALKEKFDRIQPTKIVKEESRRQQIAVQNTKTYLKANLKNYEKEDKETREDTLNDFEKKSFDKNTKTPSKLSKYASPRKTNSKYTVPFSDSDSTSKPTKNAGKRPVKNAGRNSKATAKKEVNKGISSKEVAKKFTKKSYKATKDTNKEDLQRESKKGVRPSKTTNSFENKSSRKPNSSKGKSNRPKN